MRGAQRPDQRRYATPSTPLHQVFHHYHHSQVLPVTTSVSNSPSTQKSLICLSRGAIYVQSWISRMAAAAPAPRLITNISHGTGLRFVSCHLSVTPESKPSRTASPLPPFCFSARPPSHQGGVSCEAPRRYRTPHGVLCVRMFVTCGGKEVVAALSSITAASGQSM